MISCDLLVFVDFEYLNIAVSLFYLKYTKKKKKKVFCVLKKRKRIVLNIGYPINNTLCMHF